MNDPKKQSSKYYLVEGKPVEVAPEEISKLGDGAVEVKLVSKDGGKSYQYVRAEKFDDYIKKHPDVYVKGAEQKPVSRPEGAKKRINTGIEVTEQKPSALKKNETNLGYTLDQVEQKPVEVKKVPLEVIAEQERLAARRKAAGMSASERIDITIPEFNQADLDKAEQDYESVRLNTQMRRGEQEQAQRMAESRVKELEGLRDGTYPLRGFTTGDKKPVVDFYLGSAQKEADKTTAGSFRAFSEKLQRSEGKNFLPEQYRKEEQASNEYEDTLAQYDEFLKTKYSSPDFQKLKPIWSKIVAESEKKLLQERNKTNKKIAEDIVNLNIQISGLKAMKESGKKPIGVDIDSQLEVLESKRDILSQSQQLVRLMESGNPEGAEELLGTQNVPGKTAEERLSNYATALLYAYKKTNDAAGIDENDMSAMGPMKNLYGGMKQLFMSEPDDYQGLLELSKEISAIMPIVSLRRTPVGGDDSAGEVYMKTMVQEFFPPSGLKIATAKQVAMKTQDALSYISASVENPEQAKTITEIAAPYEKYSAKDWAQMAGTTTAIMLDMVLASPVTGAYSKYTKLGKFIDKTADTGKIAGLEGVKFFDTLAGNKYGRGFTKAMFSGVKEGVNYEIAGNIFTSQEDELNFWSGFFGGALASPVSQVVEKSATPFIQKQFARVFGNESENALALTYNFGQMINGAAKVGGRGVAEVAEEFGNEIGNIYRDSDTWQDVKDQLDERFGETSELFHFAVSSFVMGAGMSAASSIGQYHSAKSKTFYSQLSPEEKAKFRELVGTVSAEMKDVAKDVETDQKEAEQAQGPSNTQEVLDEIKAGEDGVVENNLSQNEYDAEVEKIESQRKEALSKYDEEGLQEIYGILSDQTIGEKINADYDAQIAALKKPIDTTNETKPSGDIDQAAHEAATSPLNDLPQPTEAQKEAGNYKKGHINVQGLDITVENPKGSERSGDGWSVTMKNHYGYIKRTEGADGDQIDVFVGENLESQRVFIVNQNNQKGEFDEHKVMIGFDSAEAAKKAYESNYSEGWKGFGGMTEMSMDKFKEWSKSGAKTLPERSDVEVFAEGMGDIENFFTEDGTIKVTNDNGVVRMNSTEDGNILIDYVAPKKRGRSNYMQSLQTVVDRAVESGKELVITPETAASGAYQETLISVLDELGFVEKDGVYTKSPEAKKMPSGINTDDGDIIAIEDGKPVVYNKTGNQYSPSESKKRIQKNRSEILNYAEDNDLMPEGVDEDLFLGLKTQSEIQTRDKINELIGFKNKYNNWNRRQKASRPGNILLKKIEDMASELGFNVVTKNKLNVDIQDKSGKQILSRPGSVRKARPVDVDQKVEEFWQKRQDGEYDPEETDISEGEYLRDTTDPFTIANAILNKQVPLGFSDTEQGNVDAKEDAIANSIGGLNTDKLMRDTDRNDFDPKIKRAYSTKKGNLTISDVASSASTELTGERNANYEAVTVDDVWAFMQKYPTGTKEYYAQARKPEYIEFYEEKFEVETGLKATRKNLQAFADKAFPKMESKPTDDVPFSRASGRKKMTEQRLQQLVDKLNKTGLAVEVVYDQESFDAKWAEISDGGKTPNGFVSDGVVYLNPSQVQADTAVHEFGHLWQTWAKQNNPTLYELGMKLIRGSAYMSDVRNDKNYAHLATEEQIADEALARAIGDAGARLEDFTARQKFIRWIKNLFKFIGESFGFSADLFENAATMNLEQFTDAVAKALTGDISSFLDGDVMSDTEDGVRLSVSDQNELFQIKSKAVEAGTFMKAPNGNPTNLNEKQWLQVRTEAFKKWFGDWENDIENASKVIDSNGEPMVVYHGTNNEFDDFRIGYAQGWGTGIYFTDNKKQAIEEFGAKLKEVFLNIKKPETEDFYESEKLITNTKIYNDFLDEQKKKYGDDFELYYFDVLEENIDIVNRAAREIGIDGIVSKNSNNIEGLEIVVFSPNQIKSATDNEGSFSLKESNIRLSRTPDKDMFGNDVPQNEMKRRSFDATMENFSSSEALRKIISGNRQFYEVESNEEAVQKATDYILRNGVSKAYAAVTAGGSATGGKDAPRLENESIQTVRFILIDTLSEAIASSVEAGNFDDAKTISEQVTTLVEVATKAATLFGREASRIAYWKLQNPLSVVYKFNETLNEENKQRAQAQGVDLNEVQKLADELQKASNELQRMKAALIDQVDRNEKLVATIERISKERVNTETTEEVSDKATGTTSTPKKKSAPKKNRVSAEEKEAAVAIRNSALEKLRSIKRGPGGLNVSASIVGWSQDEINAIGDLALSFAKEGYFSEAAIAKEVYDLYVKELDFAGTIDEVMEAMRETGAWKMEQQKQLEKKYKAGSKGLMTEVREIMKEYNSQTGIEKMKESLSDRLISELGLSGPDAQSIVDIVENDINKKLKKAANAKAEKLADDMKLPDNKSKKKSLIDVMTDSILTSQYATDSNAFVNDILAYYGFGKLSLEQQQELLKLVRNVRAQVPGSIFYSAAVKQMANFMVKHSPDGFSFADAWIELYYASMLSGITTSILNVGSVVVNEWTMFLQDATNISAMITKLKSGSDVNTKAVRWMPAFVIRTMATFSGLREGKAVAKDVYANGSSYNKYIDHVTGTKGLGIRELEKNKYKGGRFRGKYNPYNLFKYIPRNLDAQDALNRTTIESRYFAEMIKRKMLTGEIKAASWKEMFDKINGKNIDMVAIQKTLDAEVAKYKSISGIDLTENQKKIRKNELIRQAKAEALGLSNQDVEEVIKAADIAVFTGKRNGAIGHLATGLNYVLGQRKAVRIAAMPIIPFVNIVGNVFEFMLDATPGYGIARAYGYSPSGIVNRLMDYSNNKISAKQMVSIDYFNENTAQTGAAGSIAREKQLGRAWFGTVAFALLAQLFLPDYEDDDPTDNLYRITGSKNTGDKANPPYTIWINGTPINYINIPVLAVPLSILGNYSDASFGNARLSPEDRESRLALALAAASRSTSIVFDMSFMEGVSKLFAFAADVTEQERFKKEGVSLVDSSDKMDYTYKLLTEYYGGLITKPMLQNSTLVTQVEKIFDPFTYTRQDVEGMLLYQAGIQRFQWTGNEVRSQDIFGRETLSLPGDGMVAIDHYAGLVKQSPDWDFLHRYGAEMQGPTNPMTWFDTPKGEEARYYTAKEMYAVRAIAGKELSDYCTKNYNNPVFEKEVEGKWTTRDFNRVTEAQNKIWDEYTQMAKSARDTVKGWIESGTFDENFNNLLKAREQ